MEIMFGMKLIISAVLPLSTVGNLSDNLRNCGLILSWFSYKHAEFCVCAIEQNEMHVLTQTCIFWSHFCHLELSLKLWVLLLDLATCLCPIGAVLQVPQATKLLPLLQMSVFPQGETSTHKGNQIRTTHGCVCLCPRHGKIILPASVRSACPCGIIL